MNYFKQMGLNISELPTPNLDIMVSEKWPSLRSESMIESHNRNSITVIVPNDSTNQRELSPNTPLLA